MIFITFEGIDGAGKTTLANAVAMDLFKRGYSVQSGHAPGSAYTSERIGRLTPDQAAKLFFDDIKAQDRGFDEIPERTILLQDRWAESTYVYQGIVAAAMDSEARDKIYKQAQQMTAPDLTIYLYIDPRIAAGQIENKGEIAPDLDYLGQVAAGYKNLYAQRTGIWNQLVYTFYGSLGVDRIKGDVTDLIIDTWKEKYGAV